MIIYYIAAAAAGLLVGMSLADRAYDYHLIHKANPSCRTGMFVRGKMYYIVTEREFVTKILGLEDVSRVDKPKRLTEILGKEGRNDHNSKQWRQIWRDKAVHGDLPRWHRKGF